MNNGLESFSFHSLEPSPFDISLSIESNDFGVADLASIDSETVAIEYLKKLSFIRRLKNLISQ